MKAQNIPIHIIFSLMLGLVLASLVLLPVLLIVLIIYTLLFILSWPVYKLRGRTIKFIDFPTLFGGKDEKKAA